MEEPVARTFLGTRGYLSPEQLSRRDYTKAVDSWALGIIVFGKFAIFEIELYCTLAIHVGSLTFFLRLKVLLCGCLPFDDDSAAINSEEVVKAKFQLRYPRWAKNVSASAKDLLSHLLNVDPAKRYTAEQALEHPWVQGKTAPRDNLLASPGRMQKSPALARNSDNRRKNGKAANTTPPRPTGHMARKTSI